MVLRQRVVRIETQDSLVFLDGVIQPAQVQVCVRQAVFVKVQSRTRRQMPKRGLEMGDRFFGLLLPQRQRAQVIVVAPQFVAGAARRIRNDLQERFLEPGRSRSLAPFQRDQQRIPDGPFPIPVLVSSCLFRAAEVPLPPVDLGDAAVAYRARRVLAGHLNVALVLRDRLPVPALLEIDIAEMAVAEGRSGVAQSWCVTLRIFKL